MAVRPWGAGRAAAPGRPLYVRLASIGATERRRKNQSTAAVATYLRPRFTAQVIKGQGFRYGGRSGAPDQEFLSVFLWTFSSAAAQNPSGKERQGRLWVLPGTEDSS
ncbi:hypothetical protein [Streptomyces sioyaensis]|uniref:hypothetical protein n=1 Tax=Streptomyces sioyaensis TaxID=67364 RepID=UPI0037B3E8C9